MIRQAWCWLTTHHRAQPGHYCKCRLIFVPRSLPSEGGGRTVLSGEGQEPTLALVTGASSGIGRQLAEVLARHGHPLVVASDEASIEQTAVSLRGYGVAIRAVQVDLTRASDVELLYDEVEAVGVPLGIAVLNAGVTVSGAFAETELVEELRLVDLNVRSTVHLAKLAVQSLLAGGHGRILVTSSIAGSAPNPFQATYGASKAFLRSFSHALRHEVKGTGVTVTTLIPGPTDTDILRGGRIATTRIGSGRKDDPRDVAEDAYLALMAGRARVVTGPLLQRLQMVVGGILPDRVLAPVTAFMTRPGTVRDSERRSYRRRMSAPRSR
jgi:uncharacterized protein